MQRLLLEKFVRIRLGGCRHAPLSHSLAIYANSRLHGTPTEFPSFSTSQRKKRTWIYKTPYIKDVIRVTIGLGTVSPFLPGSGVDAKFWACSAAQPRVGCRVWMEESSGARKTSPLIRSQEWHIRVVVQWNSHEV